MPPQNELLGTAEHVAAILAENGVPGSPLRLIPIFQLVALKLYAGGHKAKSDNIELLRRNPEQDRQEITRTIKRYRLRGLAQIWRELDQGA